ncbi:MAG: Hsp20/alpha crystallin family protein [Nitrospinae bacterium]|nr:Hsp20/alpha crystallin family protein [Nitrospinota bacterium]
MSNPGGKKDKKKDVASHDLTYWLRHVKQGVQGEEGGFSGEADANTMDIYENKGFIFVEMELAGVTPSDFKVFVERNKLTIQGLKAESVQWDSKVVFHCAERSFGAFKRVFELGSAIDSEKIEARYKNGVLMLKMPKLQDRRRTSRQIKVQVDD